MSRRPISSTSQFFDVARVATALLGLRAFLACLDTASIRLELSAEQKFGLGRRAFSTKQISMAARRHRGLEPGFGGLGLFRGSGVVSQDQVLLFREIIFCKKSLGRVLLFLVLFASFFEHCFHSSRFRELN